MDTGLDKESGVDRVEAARRDIRFRTLNKIDTPLERLIYLASLRDYRTGKYAHDGLALRFSEPVATEALRFEHVDLFHEVAFAPLRSVVKQVDAFLGGAGADRSASLKTWRTLEPYRVVLPVVEDGLAVRIFLSNIKFALAILATGQRSAR